MTQYAFAVDGYIAVYDWLKDNGVAVKWDQSERYIRGTHDGPDSIMGYIKGTIDPAREVEVLLRWPKPAIIKADELSGARERWSTHADVALIEQYLFVFGTCA